MPILLLYKCLFGPGMLRLWGVIIWKVYGAFLLWTMRRTGTVHVGIMMKQVMLAGLLTCVHLRRTVAHIVHILHASKSESLMTGSTINAITVCP